MRACSRPHSVFAELFVYKMVLDSSSKLFLPGLLLLTAGWVSVVVGQEGIVITDLDRRYAKNMHGWINY